MDGIEHVWNIADFGNHCSNFLLSKKYCPNFIINRTVTSYEGLFITHMNQSFVSERTAT